MEEWSQHPLRERGDLERWITAVSDRFTVATEQSEYLKDLTNHQHQSQAGPGSMGMSSPDQSLLYDGMLDGDNLDTTENYPPGPDTPVKRSRAEKLLHDNPGIYF